MYPRGLTQQRGANGSTKRPLMDPRAAGPERGMNVHQIKLDMQNAHGAMDPINRQRKKVADKLVVDCYSKFIVDNMGRQYPEVSYQTHVSIKEYSAFPSEKPPSNIPVSQLGSIKTRVLVICVKHTGRVMLQKGKYNESKMVYQIGRTWDMDELKAITKVGDDGIILSLNKDYYWKIEEGKERIWKFAKFLTNSYGGFMGRYPLLNGFLIEEFRLPPRPMKRGGSKRDQGNGVSNNVSNTSLEMAPTSQIQPRPQPNFVSPQSNRSDASVDSIPKSNAHPYQGFDFTSNGKLPIKQMKVMQVDRPMGPKGLSHVESRDQASSGPKVNEGNRHSNETRNAPGNASHPYLHSSHMESGVSLNDSQSFIFKSDEIQSSENTPSQTHPKGSVSDRTNHHHSGNDVFSMNTSKGDTISLSKSIPENDVHKFSVPDLGISQVSQYSSNVSGNTKDVSNVKNENIKGVNDDDDYSNDYRDVQNGLGISNIEDSQDIIEESTKLENDYNQNDIDSSIQDIESYMDSQLSFGNGERRQVSNSTKMLDKIQEDNPSDDVNESSQNFDSFDKTEDGQYSLHRDNGIFDANQDESAFNLSKDAAGGSSDYVLGNEKDPELDEILEEINWSMTDDSELLIKKLTRELDQVKHANVKELVSLNFSKDTVSDNVHSSLNEVDDLSKIFKKTEIDFKLLAPEVNRIENNSQGLQMKYINKKTLYNDLKDILSKVSVSSDDLNVIENFKDFASLNKLEAIEEKLLQLHNANDITTNEKNSATVDISSMAALKQYQLKYQMVSSRFVKHLNSFLISLFDKLGSNLSAHLDTFHISSLFELLDNMMVYSAFTFFEKNVAYNDFILLNEQYNKNISNFLEKLLLRKVKKMKNSNFAGRSYLSYDVEQQTHLKKSRTLRLSTRRDKLLNRLSHNDALNDSILSSGDSIEQGAKGSSNEIDDPKKIMSIVDDSKELIGLVQTFINHFFHYDDSISDFNDFISTYTHSERARLLDASEERAEGKSFSNEMISNMNSIFGNYINTFMKNVTPSELTIPVLILYLDDSIAQNEKKNQEFLVFNFLLKLKEKFKTSWTRFIKAQIELLNKAIIVAKCEILIPIKNINQLIILTESSFENLNSSKNSEVRKMLDRSYYNISDALSNLFMRDDPLLKNNDFDNKEREYRNVSIIKNIFYITDQINIFDVPSVLQMREGLLDIMAQVQNTYFQKLLSKNIGKLVEFVENYEALVKMNGKPKKYNKKHVKSLLAIYTPKDIALRVQEIHRKLEKHFITGSDMFEKDLLDKLWVDMEGVFVKYFSKLDSIINQYFDRDIESTIRKQDIHSIFMSSR